jgi:flagellar basal-body rod protein FlgC
MSELYNALTISAHGMRAQSERVRVITENVANAGNLPNSPDEDPYNRKTISFKNVMDDKAGTDVVKVDEIDRVDDPEFKRKYMPNHPAANEQGYVRTPNVSTLVEMQNMREAQRSYEANLGLIDQSRNMIMQTINLLRN